MTTRYAIQLVCNNKTQKERLIVHVGGSTRIFKPPLAECEILEKTRKGIVIIDVLGQIYEIPR